jgi:hypothetical protein
MLSRVRLARSAFEAFHPAGVPSPNGTSGMKLGHILPMAIAERVNRRLSGFLNLWDKGTAVLFGFGTACALVAVCLHFTYLKPQMGNGWEAALAAVLFGVSRAALLIFAGLAHCVNRPMTEKLGRVFLYFAFFLSMVSFSMDVTLVFRSGLRPHGVADFFASGSIMMVVLAGILEVCLFAGFWLPIALHSAEIASILERKRIEDEAVIAYIYELRAQRLREGKVDLAASSFFIRLKTLFNQKKEQLAHESNQG